MSFAQYPSLENRVALVTGGGSGIGAAIVTALARNHARVAFLDVAVEASLALVESLADARHKPLFVACDLTDIAALRAAIVRVRAEVGPVGVLVNNAANDERHEIDEVTPEYWDRAQAVNLKHQFFAAQAVRAHMIELGAGSIINFSSIAWMFGGARMVAYTSAKAAIVGLTHSLAREFGEQNIRVNAIAPGAVITERQKRLWHTEKDIAEFAARQCLHRTLVAEDIARVVLFLAADDSAMVTKQCITVDGGMR
jgi:NAD(P)-dependent dehydrogenase (short-subunit alcohol dehydrogenase family)